MNKIFDINKALSKPLNIDYLKNINIGDRFLFHTVNGSEKKYYEVVASPYFNSKLGLIMIFMREKYLLDYIIIDSNDCDVFSDKIHEDGIIMIDKIFESLLKKYGKAIKRFLSIFRQQFILLQELGVDKEIVEKYVQLFPEQYRNVFRHPTVK